MSKRLTEMDVVERSRDELARRHFEYFIPWFDNGFKMSWAHRMLARRLERFFKQVQNGESPRLMISAPPRMGKSLTVSQYFPLWGLGNDPSLEFVIASYATSLPERFSRLIRDTVRSDKDYHRLFPDLSLHPESQSIEGWQTTLNGWLVPVGRGSGLTGKGANCLIIDDLLKDSQEADSVTIREAAYDWYSSVAYTRLYPGAGVLIMATRWSTEDLSGKLQQLQDDDEYSEYSDKWEEISLPAIAEQDEYLSEDGLWMSYEPQDGYSLIRKAGDPLHPERYSLDDLRRIRATLQPRHWAALYQQSPVPEDGSFFNVDDIRFGTPPMLNDMNLFIAADTAASTAESANDSCIVCGAYDSGRNLWILDMVVDRLNSFAFCDALIDMYVKYPDTLNVGIEHGPISLAFMPLLEQRMLDRRVFLPLKDSKFMRPSQSKEVRARPFQGMTQMKKVWFPPSTTWAHKAIKQLQKFPHHPADDIVDALAWLSRLVMDSGVPNAAVTRSKPHTSWKQRLNRLNRRTKKFLEA